MVASESATTIIKDGFDLAIHSGDLPDSALVARRFAQTMIVFVATAQYIARHGSPESPDDLNHFRSVVFLERGSVQRWRFGSGQDSKRVIPTGVFRTSDIEQMRMGVLEHLEVAQAPAWLFAAELREGIVIRLLIGVSANRANSCGTARQPGDCPPKFAFSSSTWRRLSRSVPSSTQDSANSIEGARP